MFDKFPARLAILALSCFLVVSCILDDDEDDPSGVGDADDDDQGEDDDDNSCGIDYDIDMGCDESDLDCRQAQLINADREAHPAESDCAQALHWNDDLARAAYLHSKDMCERNFFAHENPDGESPFDRMADQGLTFVAAAENIYMATLGDPQDLIADAEEAFMDEPECAANHRGNILNRDYKYVGVGLYECPDGWFYVTQDFATFDSGDLRTDAHEYCE